MYCVPTGVDSIFRVLHVHGVYAKYLELPPEQLLYNIRLMKRAVRMQNTHTHTLRQNQIKNTIKSNTSAHKMH